MADPWAWPVSLLLIRRMGIQGRSAPSRLVFLPLPQPSHPNLKQLAFSTTSLEPRELDDLEGHFHGVTRAFTPDFAIPSYRVRSTYPQFQRPFSLFPSIPHRVRSSPSFRATRDFRSPGC